MKVKEIPINSIKPYENNPRINDGAVEAVAKSIQEFGFQQPIVVDKDYVIIAGHTRYKASLQLGLEKVPCVVADDLTEEQAKAYRLADNKVGELAQWDFDLLRQELDEVFEIDMSDFGFDMNHVDIDWASVDDLSEETYEKPQDSMLRCPHCNHVDNKNFFIKVEP